MTINVPGKLIINRRNITNMILVQFSGSVISQGLVALVMLLTARQLGPEAYGQLVGSLTVVTFSSIIFNLGLDIWLLREGGRNPEMAGNLAGSVLTIKLAIGSVWLIVIFLLSNLINSQALPDYFIRWNAAIILLDSLFVTTLTSFKATLRNPVNAIVEVLSDSFWFIATILLVGFGVEKALPYLQARFLIIGVSFFTSIFLVRRLLRASASLSIICDAIKHCLPYAISEFLTLLYMRIDIIIVSLMLGEFAVGIYSPAVSIINALFIIPAAVHMVMVPVLTSLFSSDINQGWKVSTRYLIIMIVIGMILSICVYLGVWLIPIILGNEYRNTQELLRILSPILLVHSISFGLAGVLIATNQQKSRSSVQAISATSNIILNFLVIGVLGIRGVAYVYLISDIILMVGYFWFIFLSYHDTSRIKP